MIELETNKLNPKVTLVVNHYLEGLENMYKTSDHESDVKYEELRDEIVDCINSVTGFYGANGRRRVPIAFMAKKLREIGNGKQLNKENTLAKELKSLAGNLEQIVG